MGWAAELQLGFERVGEVTRLRRHGGVGPLYVQKPFYPEGGVCHVYLLHPPGGVVGGDTISFKACVEGGGEVLFTTPAATKFLRSRNKAAVQTQEISVADNACAEWLPQETIVFNEAVAHNKTLIRLDDGARFVGCDVFALGRPANEEAFAKGRYSNEVHIQRRRSEEDRYRTVYLDRQRYAGGGVELQAGWGLAGHSVTGTLVATPVDKDMLKLLQKHLEKMSNTEKNADLRPAVRSTLVGDVLVVRAFGHATAEVQIQLRRFWTLLRPLLLQRPAAAPAIWRT